MSTGKDGFARYPLYFVKWHDAAHTGGNGWLKQSTLEIPLLCAEAVGFLVYEGKNTHGQECIVLAAAQVFNEEGEPDFCMSFVIPKGMVQSMQEIVV